MRNNLHSWALAAVALGFLGCGPSSPGSDVDGGGGGIDATPQPTCTEGATQCSGTTKFQTCQNNTWVDSQTCTGSQICSNPTGCVDCIPGKDYCVGDAVHACSATGSDGGETEVCTGDLHCSGGACKDLCAEAEDNSSYIGCEYWAADLDNAVEVITNLDPGGLFPVPRRDFPVDGVCPGSSVAATLNVCTAVLNALPIHQGLCEPDDTCLDAAATCESKEVCVFSAATSPFAVVVSNPQSFAIDVLIENQTGTTHTETVAAGAVAKLFPQLIGFADQSLDHTSQSASAYKLSAAAPFVAYQFNPLNNENVFSNDGSLLLPRTTFGTEYYAMSWQTSNRRRGAGAPNLHDYHSYVSIVAWEDDTQITVTPSGNVKAGPILAAISSGTPTNFTLNAFEVLTLQGANTEAAPSQDLTGTKVEAANGKTFGVFAGNEAVGMISTGDDANCCADHIEEMMFPTSTWGNSFALARSKQRRSENDFLRIIAKDAGTTITFSPSPATGSCGTLGAGQWCEVEISGDTEISSNDKPILVGHYLSSAQRLGTIITPSEGNGDPSMSLAVPVEQFRANYTFLVPDEYTENYVSIVAPASVSVTLDGNDVSGQLAPFSSSSHKAGRVMVNAGQHTVSCVGGCSLEVYGYSAAVSYLFPAGLDLKNIVID